MRRVPVAPRKSVLYSPGTPRLRKKKSVSWTISLGEDYSAGSSTFSRNGFFEQSVGDQAQQLCCEIDNDDDSSSLCSLSDLACENVAGTSFHESMPSLVSLNLNQEDLQEQVLSVLSASSHSLSDDDVDVLNVDDQLFSCDFGNLQIQEALPEECEEDEDSCS